MEMSNDEHAHRKAVNADNYNYNNNNNKTNEQQDWTDPCVYVSGRIKFAFVFEFFFRFFFLLEAPTRHKQVPESCLLSSKDLSWQINSNDETGENYRLVANGTMITTTTTTTRAMTRAS